MNGTEMSVAETSGAEILERIRRMVVEELDFDGDLVPTMHLVEDLELDSIRLLTLAVAVEDHFRIALDEEDESSIETVADLIQLIERKRAPVSEEASLV